MFKLFWKSKKPGNAITEQEFKKLENEVWLDFLTNATPIEIHQSVITSNWDGNDFLLTWIKNNPKVDKATILIAYWMTAPRWRKQFLNREEVEQRANWELKEFDFVEEVEQKYIANFWTNNDIEMDPKSDQDGCDWTSNYLDKKIVREIPTIMFQKLEGKKVISPDNFEEGLPTSPINYSQRLWDLTEKYQM